MPRSFIAIALRQMMLSVVAIGGAFAWGSAELVALQRSRLAVKWADAWRNACRTAGFARRP